MLERHRHLQLKAYYKEIKRELNIPVEDSITSNFSTEKHSSSESTCKPCCSCVLCDMTDLRNTKSESKALQEVYNDIEGAKELDKEDYHN